MKECLERALSEDLDGVLLVKFKDNGFQVDSSKIINRLEKIGALHQLQHDIMHCDD